MKRKCQFGKATKKKRRGRGRFQCSKRNATLLACGLAAASSMPVVGGVSQPRLRGTVNAAKAMREKTVSSQSPNQERVGSFVSVTEKKSAENDDSKKDNLANKCKTKMPTLIPNLFSGEPYTPKAEEIFGGGKQDTLCAKDKAIVTAVLAKLKDGTDDSGDDGKRGTEMEAYLKRHMLDTTLLQKLPDTCKEQFVPAIDMKYTSDGEAKTAIKAKFEQSKLTNLCKEDEGVIDSVRAVLVPDTLPGSALAKSSIETEMKNRIGKLLDDAKLAVTKCGSELSAKAPAEDKWLSAQFDATKKGEKCDAMSMDVKLHAEMFKKVDDTSAKELLVVPKVAELVQSAENDLSTKLVTACEKAFEDVLSKPETKDPKKATLTTAKSDKCKKQNEFVTNVRTALKGEAMPDPKIAATFDAAVAAIPAGSDTQPETGDLKKHCTDKFEELVKDLVEDNPKKKEYSDKDKAAKECEKLIATDAVTKVGADKKKEAVTAAVTEALKKPPVEIPKEGDAPKKGSCC